MVTIVNRFDKEESIGMDWQDDAKIPLGNYHIQDLWSGRNETDFITTFCIKRPSFDSPLLR